jgi:hypothetical protein
MTQIGKIKEDEDTTIIELNPLYDQFAVELKP